MLVERERILSWLKGLKLPDSSAGTYRHSASSDATAFSSCFAVYIMAMLDALDELPEKERKSWSDRLISLQNPQTGLFRADDLPADSNSGGHDETYVSWQLTTFCLSALAELDRAMPRRIARLSRWHDRARVRAWLESLNWEDPWCAGNMVMFLCIMLLWDAERLGEEASGKAVDHILDWHDEFQRPDSGFWGKGTRSDYIEGMGGALHQFLIYSFVGRPIPRHKKIIDRMLQLQQRDGLFYPGMGGDGCLDYDAVNILAMLLHQSDYRQGEIKATLERSLEGMKSVACPQGGFVWNTPESFRWYDWAGHAFSFLRHQSLYHLYYSSRSLLSARLHRGRPRMPRGWTRTGIPAQEPDLFATFMRMQAAFLSLEVVDNHHPDPVGSFLRAPGLGWHFSSPPLNTTAQKEEALVRAGRT